MVLELAKPILKKGSATHVCTKAPTGTALTGRWRKYMGELYDDAVHVYGSGEAELPALKTRHCGNVERQPSGHIVALCS